MRTIIEMYMYNTAFIHTDTTVQTYAYNHSLTYIHTHVHTYIRAYKLNTRAQRRDRHREEEIRAEE